MKQNTASAVPASTSSKSPGTGPSPKPDSARPTMLTTVTAAIIVSTAAPNQAISRASP